MCCPWQGEKSVFRFSQGGDCGRMTKNAQEDHAMRYQNITKGIFLARPNRFIAHVLVDGETVVCHVKNTGRCAELLRPGVPVYLEKAQNPARKTAFDLIAVEKGDLLINMDAQAPNRVFAEWAAEGKFLPEVQVIQPEYRYGDSRLDFVLTTPQGLHLVEVKGVTLEENGHARFPDAPTERGVRHLAVFVLPMEGMPDFAPNDATHPAFGEALRHAAANGVRVEAWECAVTPESLRIVRPVKTLL